MTKEQAELAVELIIREIDRSTLLGAAFDCVSEAGKERFKNKLIKIILEV